MDRIFSSIVQMKGINGQDLVQVNGINGQDLVQVKGIDRIL